ncbi:unnamed protein product [Ascophyllum nodosum]
MRLLFWVSFAVLGIVAGLGLRRNDGNKFVRTLTQQGCVRNYANTAEVEYPELVCCSDKDDDDGDYGVCHAGHSRSTRILTSHWAFVIPFLGLFVNMACDKLSGEATVARTRARLNRFLLYLAVVVIRTGFLYIVLNFLQDLLQGEKSSNCWYAHLRRTGVCSDHFDFADHTVLAVCQYYAIQVFEVYCILEEYLDLWRAPRSKDSKSRPWISTLCAVLPITVCASLAGLSLFLLFNTTAFFHARGETLVALLLSWFVVGSHLLRLMNGFGNGLWSKLSSQEEDAVPLSYSSPSRGVFLPPLE